ncbi:hypothetical protein JHK85_002037 [Glycine max]|nr:hypothetical protein JHK85_002037 [Glycine max]
MEDWNDEQCDDTLTMTTVSQHFFGDDSETPSFSISIIENMKEDYGLFVWPCSVVLAEYIWQHKHRFSGATVVELGAGTSLPGLVAAKLGARVTLTDDSTRLEVLDNMRRVCDLNKLECNVLGLTWGVWDSSIFSLQPTIILGADVLYDSKGEKKWAVSYLSPASVYWTKVLFLMYYLAFDNLFATVTFLLRNSPGGHHLIEFLMGKWGLKCLKLLDGFSFLPPDKASLLSGNIQLAEIGLISKDNA